MVGIENLTPDEFAKLRSLLDAMERDRESKYRAERAETLFKISQMDPAPAVAAWDQLQHITTGKARSLESILGNIACEAYLLGYAAGSAAR